MIMNPADIEASVDAWFRHGETAPAFNGAAAGTPVKVVNMAAANDSDYTLGSRPGILGFNR